MKIILRLVLPMVGFAGLLKYIFLGILSGLCSFLFINAVTKVVGLIVAGNFNVISKEYIIIFIAIILLFVWVRRALALAIIKLSQAIFWRLRKEVLDLVLNTNYQQLASRKVEVHAAIVSDVNVMTNASLVIINFFTSVILAVSCLVYLASISLILFLITLAIAALGITVYYITAKTNLANFQKARVLETTYQGYFNAILDGFKEVYMDPGKGRAIKEEKISHIVHDAYKNNYKAHTGFLNNQITGQILFYILISSILLFFSLSLHIKSGETISFVFTLLYLLGSIETIMVLLPQLARAKIASNHLLELRNKLEQAVSYNPVSEKNIFREEFEQISVSDLEFYYGEHDKSFGIGPVNISIQKGETIFIYGGNGSGKTTFVHAVLGLCRPSAGEIRCNGVVIDDEHYPDYRALFAVVFSDFYLFKEVLGVDRVDTAKWDYYLQLFELEGMVTLEGKAFSTTDLSTGQRKRLALIAALLEEKPVLVIDEWAADQDPYFRKKFYTEILPLLKEEGITIIAITHDDKYYQCADKLYKMDYGRLVEENARIYI